MDTPGSRSIAQELTAFGARTSLMIVLLTACYYVLPDDGPFEDLQSGLRAGWSLAALIAFALVLRIQVRTIRRRPSVWGRAEALLTALYLLILAFAISYDRMAGTGGDVFAGINNRTDALYFTVTVVSTVGFGDIHAVSTGARAVVTVQMLVNVFFVGAALRLLGGAANRAYSGESDESGTDSS